MQITLDGMEKKHNGCIDLIYSQWNYADREKNQQQMRLVFALYYGCGLRISEGQKLMIQDIDFDKRTIFVRQRKFYKDRIVPMSEGVFKIVENYVYNFRKDFWLERYTPNYIIDIPFLESKCSHF